MKRFWNFKNQGGTVELRIDGDLLDDENAWLAAWLGGAPVNEFRDELSQYKGRDITVWVNSYGGDVFAGLGMYNALMWHKQSGGHVTTYGEKVYSAAVMPFLAGDKREMTPGGILMVHNPLTSVFGYADDLRKVAESLDKVKEGIIDVYEQATGLDRNVLSKLMDNETEMTADEAVKEGLATGVADLTVPASVAANYSGIVNSVKTARAGIMKYMELSNQGRKEPNMAEIKNLAELRNAYPALVKEAEDSAIHGAVSEAVKNERQRVAELDALNDGSDMVRKIIDHAKAEGKTAKDVEFYVNTAKENNKVPEGETTAAQHMSNVMKDFGESGAGNVGASAPVENKEKDVIANAVAMAVKGKAE